MKKKYSRILGVALTLVLLASFFGFATPVSAANVGWSGIANPSALSTRLNLADCDVGPIAVSPDGNTLFAAVETEAVIAGISTAAGEWALLQSTDGGHNWTATGLIMNPGPITGIAISSNFATDGTMYVAAWSGTLGTPAVFRTNNSGTTFTEIKAVTAEAAIPTPTTAINSIDMWPASPYPYVMVGTDTDVWVLQDAPFGVWRDQEVNAVGPVNIAAVAFAPDFATTNYIWAVTAAGVVTCTNSPGAWGTILGDTGALVAAVSADIGFPDNYSSTTAPYLWVGLNSGGLNTGGVWRVRGLPIASQAIPQLSTTDIRSLAVSGSMATATILAGQENSARISKSVDGGIMWIAPVLKQPTGDGATYVVMAPDFATSNIAYVGTSDFIHSTFTASQLIISNNGSASIDNTIYLSPPSSARLVGGVQNGSDYASVSITISGTMKLSDVTRVVYNYYFANAVGDGYGVHMCFYTHDPNDGQTADITLYSGLPAPASNDFYGNPYGGTPGQAGWNTVTVTPATTGFGWFGDETGSPTFLTGFGTNARPLSDYQTATGFEDHVIDRIDIEYGWWSTGDASEPAYVDDIAIPGFSTGVEESAFQVSNNAGMSFNQVGLIDTTFTAIDDVAVVSLDTIFMVSDNYSLWKTEDATATAPVWERILSQGTVTYPMHTLADITFVETSPEFATDGVVYAADSGTGIVKAIDGGSIFAPLPPASAAITTLHVVDATFAFLGAAGQVYRTDDGGYSWLPATTAPQTGADIMSIATSPAGAMPPGQLLVGDASGNVFMSMNRGVTFFPLGFAVGGIAGDTYVAFDAGYATNSTVYAGGDAVIARFNVAVPTAPWVAIDATIPVGVAGASVFYYSVTAGSATISVANDPNGNVTIVGTTVTLPDATDVVVITAGAGGATVAVTAISGTQTCVPVSPATLTANTSMTVAYLTGGAGIGASTITGLVTSPDGTLYGSNLLPGQGMERSLNPTATTTAPVEGAITPVFERATSALALGATFNGLWLRVDETLDVVGSKNVFFAIDETGVPPAYVDRIMTYTDTLAAPVVLAAPEDGAVFPREAAVTLEWETLTGARSYYWQIARDAAFMLPVQDGSGFTGYPSDSFTGLDAGRTYYWRVRVDGTPAGAPGLPVLSRWSETRTFTTLLGARPWHPFFNIGGVAPGPGASDVLTKPTFQWNGADWATSYQLVLADNAAFTGATTKTLTTTSWVSDQDLGYSTTWYWKVIALSATSESEWSDVGVFTTMAEPAPPVVVEEVQPPVIEVIIPEQPAAVEVTPVAPAYLLAMIIIGAVLVIFVVVLIVRTRRPV